MPKTQIIKGEEDFDENGILRDGGRYRVDVRMTDSLGRAVAKQVSKQHLTDGYGDAGLALNRPGFRALSGGAPKTQAAWDALNKATADAYALDERWKASAWRDAILDVSDDDDTNHEAHEEAKHSDCYADYEAEMRDAWRSGNE